MDLEHNTKFDSSKFAVAVVVPFSISREDDENTNEARRDAAIFTVHRRKSGTHRDETQPKSTERINCNYPPCVLLKDV